jgi:IS30 family transposase
MRSRPGNGKRLTVEERAELRRRITNGETFAIAAAAVGCSAKSIQRWLRRSGGMRPRQGQRGTLRLSLAEREEISRGLRAGESYRQVAARLQRAPSTVSREVRRNGGRPRYRAWHADGQAGRRMRRPKHAKLLRCPRLRAEVERRLASRWSPQQIAGRLVRDYPDDAEMRVSHETIYQSLFVQARGALRLELTRYLRTARTYRRPRRRSTAHGRGQLLDMTLISSRPAEIADRAVPGHWEGDLLVGKAGQSAIGTLIERQTRLVLLVHLPHGRFADHVRAALAAKILELPA